MGRKLQNYRTAHETVRAQSEWRIAKIGHWRHEGDKKLKIKFGRCIYSMSIEYGDSRIKDDIKEDTRLAPKMQKSIDETIPENIRL
jgi:hypothetical protein